MEQEGSHRNVSNHQEGLVVSGHGLANGSLSTSRPWAFPGSLFGQRVAFSFGVFARVLPARDAKTISAFAGRLH